MPWSCDPPGSESMLTSLIDDVRKITAAVGLNMKGIEEFKEGLNTINEVKNVVTTLSGYLKELKESVRVSFEDTKNALTDLGNRVSIIRVIKKSQKHGCLIRGK